MTYLGSELSKLTIRRFLLRRDKDVSGTSGLGHVAEGVCFSDGSVAMRWRGRYPSTTIYASTAHLEAIHGHGGGSVIEWLDAKLETSPNRVDLDVDDPTWLAAESERESHAPVLCPLGCPLHLEPGAECPHGYTWDDPAEGWLDPIGRASLWPASTFVVVSLLLAAIFGPLVGLPW